MAPDNAAPWINFAAALLALNQPKAARAAARRAVKLAPGDAAAHNAFGLAAMAVDDLDSAQRAFTEAIRLARSHQDAWLNLVLALVRRGKIGFALQAIEQGLAACHGAGALEAAGAGLLLVIGDQDEAMRRLRAILAREPSCLAARLNLANALLVDNLPGEALAVLGESAPRGRDGAHWRAHRALSLLKLGRDAEAERELDQIATPYGDAEILILWRRIHLALKANQIVAAEAMATRMAELADREGAALFEHRVIAHFDPARYHEGQKRLDRAFHHWTAGHRLVGRLQPFSREEHGAFFEASRSAYSARRLREGSRAQNHDSTPVFIVGLPRSGTTLTEQILASHSEVYGAGERAVIHQAVSRLAGPPLRASSLRLLSEITDDKLDGAASEYLQSLHALAPDARIILDKMPGNALHLGFIATLLPGARIILCTRDPTDTALSIFQHRFFGWHPYAHDLADLGWYIAAHTKLMDHWREVLPIPILEVRLSDWVNQFDSTLQYVLDFLHLPMQSACARFYENDRLVRTASSLQVRRPLNAGGIGRWRKYADHLAPLLAELDGSAS